GGSGFATGLGSGAGVGVATGAGGGAGLAAGSRAGAGFSGSLAQPASRKPNATSIAVAVFTGPLPLFLVCRVAPNLTTADSANTSAFQRKRAAFCEGKPMLA